MEGPNSATSQRPLLQTKINLPRTRAHVIARPRLLDRLNSAFAVSRAERPRLTLITGPAGYGKTTLAVQWVDALSRPVAWLSLDRGDNDEARFVAYLIAAIARVLPEVGRLAQERLSAAYLWDDTEAVLTALLNALAAQETAVVVVLDDYQVITADAVHQAVAFILQHLPLQLHLVITSRAEPPLPIALLRARGSLSSVDAADLRFTREEAARFMSGTMGLSLDDEQMDRLEQQVEGWVTGLQLVALALRESVDLAEAFSSNQRYLVDYLGQQVLARQPAEVETFLLETSILSHLNADLCQQVSGVDSRACLDQIERANLFLIPLDAERGWYRYHHLFADFLHNRLMQTRPPDAIARLHRRAARWYEAQRQPHVAVEHALAAGDPAGAARLVMVAAPQLLKFGEGQTLRQWLEAIPEAHRRDAPALTLYYIWALTRTGEFSRAADLLEEVSAQLSSPAQWGEWSALRARLAVMTGDTDINIRFSHKALAKLPADAHMLRCEVAINLGFSHFQNGDLAAAREAFATAARQTGQHSGLWAIMFATFYWGQTYEREGRLPAAYEVYEQGLATAVTSGNGQPARQAPSPAVGFMQVGLGRVLYEWNRLEEAELMLRQALANALRGGDHKMLYYSREGMALLAAAVDDWTTVEQLLDEHEGEDDATRPSRLRAHLALRRGDAAPARQWVRHLKVRVTDEDEQVQQFPFAYTTLIRLRLHERRYEGLMTLLRRLEAVGQTRNNVPFLIVVYLLQALVLARQGAQDEALTRLQRSLALAEPGRYRRLFLDFSDPSLTRLLHLAAGNGVTAAIAHALLAAGASTAQSDGASVSLTARELEVLEQMAAGLTNRQIAEQLIISPNTVKAHTRRLYEKLAVRSRTAAVVRARESGLLDL